jgi:hypothetical protein
MFRNLGTNDWKNFPTLGDFQPVSSTAKALYSGLFCHVALPGSASFLWGSARNAIGSRGGFCGFWPGLSSG